MAKGGEIKASRHHRRDPGSIAATFRESLNVRFETGKMSAAHRALIDPVDNFDRGSSAPPHIIGIADDLRSQNRETGCFQIRSFPDSLPVAMSAGQAVRPCVACVNESHPLLPPGRARQILVEPCGDETALASPCAFHRKSRSHGAKERQALELEAGRKIASELHRQPAGRYVPPPATNDIELKKWRQAISGLQANSSAPPSV
jgi:hypothetical protein